MVVQEGGQQVVGRSNSMEITCKVQVQILHGNHLGIPASGSSALNAKAGAKGRLSEGDDGFPAKLCHGLSQSHGRGRLSLSGGSGIDGGHKDELPVLSVLDLFPEFIREFCFVLSVELQVLLRDTDGGSHIFDVHHFCFLRDLNI